MGVEPGEVHHGGVGLREAESVGDRTTGDGRGTDAVDAQVGRIHANDRLAEGEGDLSEVRDLHAGGRIERGDGGRSLIHERVIPETALAREIEGVRRRIEIRDAVIRHPGDGNRTEGGLQKGEAVVRARAGESGGGRAVDEQVAGVHAGHCFAEEHVDLRQADDDAGRGSLGQDGRRARIQEIELEHRSCGNTVEGLRHRIEVHDAVAHGPRDGDRAKGRLREAEGVDRVTGVAAGRTGPQRAAGGHAVDEQVSRVHAGHWLGETHGEVREEEDGAGGGRDAGDARRDELRIREERVELSVETEIAAVERLVEGVDGNRVRAIHEVEAGIRQRVGRVASTGAAGFVGGGGGVPVVGNVACGKIDPGDFHAVDPRHEAVIALRIEKEIRDCAGVLDVELAAQVDAGVIARHVIEQRAGVRGGVVGIAEVERRGRRRPASVIEARLTPRGDGRRRFGLALRDAPDGVRLRKNGARIQRITPRRVAAGADEGVRNRRQIHDAVARSPGDVHGAGGRLGEAEGVGRAAAVQSEGGAAIHEKIPGIHAHDRFAEGDSDLR